MIIVKEIATNIVIYLLEDNQDVALNAKYLSIDGAKTFSGVSDSTYVLESITDRPSHFQGGAYAYSSGWSIGNQAVLDGILPEVIEDKINELGALALNVTNRGVTVDGIPISSDDESTSSITSTLSLMGRNPTETIDFKSKDGWEIATIDFKSKDGWEIATKATMEGFQNAIWALRKATNANNKMHENAIRALTTVQEVLDYDITVGW